MSIVLTVRVDGSYSREREAVAIGISILGEGVFKGWEFGERLLWHPQMNNESAEWEAALRGVQVARSLDYPGINRHRLRLVTDSRAVAHGKDKASRPGAKRYLDRLATGCELQVELVGREKNGRAHRAAKAALSLKKLQPWLEWE